MAQIHSLDKRETTKEPCDLKLTPLLTDHFTITDNQEFIMKHTSTYLYVPYSLRCRSLQKTSPVLTVKIAKGASTYSHIHMWPSGATPSSL